MGFKNFFSEFREFAVRGNVVDLAVGIIIGAAFNGVINSLVKDIVMPPIGLVLKSVDFSNLYVNLGSQQYANLAEAQRAGAPTINYGLFINTLISFLITALVVFFVVRQINRMRRRKEEGKDIEPSAKLCPFCFTSIPHKAVRCPACTSTLA